MKRSRVFLAAVVAFQFLHGLIVPDPLRAGVLGGVTIWVLSVALPVAFYSWCQADILERNISYPAGTPILVGVFPPVGLPIYFLRTRTMLGALFGIGKSLLFVALCLAMYHAGEYVHRAFVV
jgi:hypothetical protein